MIELTISQAVALAGLVGFEDEGGSLAMLREVPVEAIDRQIQLPVGVPLNVEIVFGERPVACLGRELVPGEAARLVEPEAVGIGIGEVVKLGELGRADPGVEIRWNWMHGFGHQSLLGDSFQYALRLN